MSYFIYLFIFLYLFILIKRVKQQKYNPKQNYIYDLESNYIKTISIQHNQLPIDIEKDLTLFLKVELLFNPLSYLFRPYIQIDGIKHSFEYGAIGYRYINLSHATNGVIKTKFIRYSEKNLRLYGFKNNIDKKDKTLVIAPHADDAELAGFGLYKSQEDVTIVTITAGENGVCNYCSLYNNKYIATLQKAKLRAFDAITVPMLADVDIQNSVALGYFGSTLEDMRCNPTQEVYSHIDNIHTTQEFRKVTHSSFNLKEQVKPTYNSLKNDLETILLTTKPKLILTPHPAIDSHKDHKESTYLIIELILKLNLNTKLLLYTNHLVTDELYPLGEIGEYITLPPNFKIFPYDSLYSFSLDKELQNDKYFAIEAMHDLRDSLLWISTKKVAKLLQKRIKNQIFSKNKSYFRRSVRANELFFVAYKRDTLEQLLQMKNA